jgi:hypothetical protein
MVFLTSGGALAACDCRSRHPSESQGVVIVVAAVVGSPAGIPKLTDRSDVPEVVDMGGTDEELRDKVRFRAFSCFSCFPGNVVARRCS